MRRLRDWLGDGAPPPEDSILLLLSDPPAQAAPAAALVAALTVSGQRLSVVAAVTRRCGAAGVAAALPGAVVRRPRVLPGPAARLTLAALRVRAVLVVGGVRPPARSLARLSGAACRRGVPVFALAAADLDRMAAGGKAGLREDRGDGAPAAPPLGVAAAAGRLIAAMGAERGQGSRPDAFAGRIARLLRGSRGRFVPGLSRLPDLAALRRRLGAPETVMCLGNGPSSADPRLAAMAHDALFRVNHQWMRRGFLARPDLIFAGVKRSMRAAGRVPVCVATPAKERALIATRLLEPWHGRATYAVAEEVAAAVIPRIEGPRRPTTGAYMIAVAVALAPERLIVAGMDMFSHPEGAYPAGGEPAGVVANAYAPSHDADTDAAFIRACLAAYGGEIVALGPAFAALARSVPAPRFRLTVPAEGGDPPALAPRTG